MIVIVGAGGHGQVVADIFRARRVAGLASATTGFLDDDPSRQGLALAGGVVFGPVSSLDQIDRLGTVVAIGDNRTRARVHQRLAEAGENFAVAEHPRSVVADDVEIGDGSMVCAGAIVSTGTVIGRNTIINTGATVDHHSTIGDHVHIGAGRSYGRRGASGRGGAHRHRRRRPSGHSDRRLEHRRGRRGGHPRRGAGHDRRRLPRGTDRHCGHGLRRYKVTS